MSHLTDITAQDTRVGREGPVISLALARCAGVKYTGRVTETREIREAAPRLPRELFFIYFFTPLVAAPALSTSFFEAPPSQMLRDVAATGVPFLAIGLTIHASYTFVLPRLFARSSRPWQRGALHVAVSGFAALAIGTLVYPFVSALLDRGPSLGVWLVRCLVVTCAVMLPALAVARLRHRVDAQREAALRAQLEALQARTNPHFLFNAMNTIACLVRQDPRLAEHTVVRLSEVLRYALSSSHRDRVALGEELAMLRDYLEIQRARFGSRLRYAIAADPGLESTMVPPLVLEPLVENAVVHGVASTRHGAKVQVTARHSGNSVVLRVEDDGPGPGGSRHRGTGTSLGDLARRLELLFDGACPLITRKNERGGFSAELSLPVPTVQA